MRKSLTKNIWRKDTPAAKNIDAFINASTKQTQNKLRQLRKIVRTVVPEAEEKISYKMPAYEYNGKWLVGFAGFKNHIGFYPMSGSFLEEYKDQLKDYKSSKGAVQFPLDKPLPVALIKMLIRARMKRNEVKEK